MRRLKNGRMSVVLTRPATSNTPAPSRKNARFSGKKSGKRVRFTCRRSASVSAKSVLTVMAALRLGVRFLKISTPAADSPSPLSAATDACGRRSRPRPCWTPSSPSRRPASARLPIQMFCRAAVQRTISCRRLISRSTLNPHVVWPGLNRSVLNGISISAIHPWSVMRATAFQMPSHSRLRRSALFDTCPSARAPAGFTSKKKPFRWSKNGSRTIRIRSSTSSSASRVSCVDTMSRGDRS